MEDALALRSGREQRILARRERVQARLKALREGEKTGEKGQEKKEEVGKGKQQILESKRRLLRKTQSTNAAVTSVKLAGNDRENQRRIEEEQVRQELRSRLLNEAEQSARQNAAVAMRWADLFSIQVPQDLFEEMEKQKAACDRILSSKDGLINDIKAELKRKDDEYVKMLKRQAEDIDTLLAHMATQFTELQTAYRQELIEIESSFMAERGDLLKRNKGELDGLFQKRNKREVEFQERYLAQVEEYQRALEVLRVADAEEYNTLKIRLETDIQNLEQHLEAMRATYQLNTEKLEYNYRVLQERDHENQSTINQQKRKISRQRDALSNLKSKYGGSDKRFQEDNAKLTDEYKRITDQFKDLQSKFRHFELVDLKKYQDMWSLKESELAVVVKDVLQADKIIHEQQLGWDWRAPSSDLFISPHAAETHSKAGGDAAGAADDDADQNDDEERAQKVANLEVKQRLQQQRNWAALMMLMSDAGFLVDAKAKKMIDALPKDEQSLVKAEAIVRALGVTDGPTFDALLDALTAGSNVELRATGMATQTTAAGVEKTTHPDDGSAPVLVHPDDALKRLKAFVDAENLTPSKAGKASAVPSRLAGVSRRVAEKEREYWQRMANVISPKMNRVWCALEKHVELYFALLKKRAGELRSVESLSTQNKELRQLLNQYLSSSINEELQIPPSQII